MEQERFKTQETLSAQEQARRAALRNSFGAAVPARPVPRPAAFQPRPPVSTTPAPEPVKIAPPPLPPVVPEAATTNVSINISLPTLKVPKVSKQQLATAKTMTLKLFRGSVAGFHQAKPHILMAAKKARSLGLKLPLHRFGPVLAILLVVALAGTGAKALWSKHNTDRANHLAAVATAKLATNTTAKPNFKPVVPASKTAIASGAAGQTAFDSKKGTFSYNDTIKGTPVVVSQQPVPTSFKTGQAAVTSIAKSLGATQAVVTNSGATGYVATDPKSNAQTVVFSLNNLLIFIRSPFTHQTNEWQQYLTSLKQQ